MENESVQAPIKQTTERKSKAPAICSALCVVLALAGIGFGVYGMFFNKTATPNNTDANKPADADVKVVKKEAPSKKAVAEVLSEKYGVEEFNNSGCGGSAALKLFNDGELDDTFRMAFIIQKDFYNIEELEYDDCEGMCEYRNINYDDINEKYHLYFGNSSDLKKEDYNALRIMGVESAEYNKNTNSFKVKYLGGLGCAFVPVGSYVNVASVEANDEGFTALVSSFRLDASDAVSYGARLSDCSEDVYNCPILDLDSIKTEESFYNMDFIEEDGEYKLTGVTKE